MSDIASHIHRWVTHGVISPGAAKKIFEFEGLPVDPTLESRGRNSSISIISIFGAVLVAAGIALLIGKNWDVLNIVARFAIIIGTLLIAYISGWYLQEHTHHTRVGQALMLVGAGMYGLGLFLVAQFFHTNANPSILFLLWGVGLLPLIALRKSEPVFIVATIVTLLWSMFAMMWSNGGPSQITPHGWFAIAAAVLIALALKFHFKFGLIASLAGAYVWFGTCVAALLHGADEVFVPTLLFLLLAALAAALGARVMTRLWPNIWSAPLVQGVSAIVILFSLNILSWNDSLENYSVRPVLDPWLGAILVLLLAVFIAHVVTLVWVHAKTRAALIFRGEVLLSAAAILLAGLFYWFPVTLESHSQLFHPFVLWWNVALLAYNVLLVIMGYVEHRQTLVNLGILSFGIHVFSRYTDVFALRLGTSFSFIVGGLLLIALALLLGRVRKSVLASMEHQVSETI